MRTDYRETFSEVLQAVSSLGEAVHKSSLEPELLELVKLRASQVEAPPGFTCRVEG